MSSVGTSGIGAESYREIWEVQTYKVYKCTFLDKLIVLTLSVLIFVTITKQKQI